MYNRILILLFLSVDLMVFALAISIMYYIGFFGGVQTREITNLYIFLALSWLVVFVRRNFFSLKVEFIPLLRKTIDVYTSYAFIILGVYFLLELPYGRLTLFFFLSFLLVLILVSRVCGLLIFKRIRYFKKYIPRVYILASGIHQQLSEVLYLINKNSFVHVIGCYDLSIIGELDKKILAERIVLDAQKNNVSELYALTEPLYTDFYTHLISLTEDACLRLRFLPLPKPILGQSLKLSVEDDVAFFVPYNDAYAKPLNRIKKRIFDLIFSLFVIVLVLSWLFPLICLLIYFDSRGSCLFLQKRLGRGGKVFTCLKFRTMHKHPLNGVMHTQKDDQRITRLGKFLRKSNLDELPQFINVLLGHMSIVGPRPHMLQQNDIFKQKVAKYMVRHMMKPGITGWAQISGYRGDVSGDRLEKRVNHDLWYLEHWSFYLDCEIILKTLVLIFKGDKYAY